MNMYISPIPWNARKTETASIVIVPTPAVSMPYVATACIITGGVASCRHATSLIMLKKPMTVPLIISSVYGKKTRGHG
jgi:hypothetical protein